jgi:hypothetical protein
MTMTCDTVRGPRWITIVLMTYVHCFYGCQGDQWWAIGRDVAGWTMIRMSFRRDVQVWWEMSTVGYIPKSTSVSPPKSYDSGTSPRRASRPLCQWAANTRLIDPSIPINYSMSPSSFDLTFICTKWPRQRPWGRFAPHLGTARVHPSGVKFLIKRCDRSHCGRCYRP